MYMTEGFTFEDATCLVLLFAPWVLDSRVKMYVCHCSRMAALPYCACAYLSRNSRAAQCVMLLFKYVARNTRAPVRTGLALRDVSQLC